MTDHVPANSHAHRRHGLKRKVRIEAGDLVQAIKRYALALAASPTNPKVIYVGGANSVGGDTLSVSTDGGGTWSEDLYAGNNGSKGHLRAEITQAATAGSTWGFNYGGMPVQVWTPGTVSSQDLAYATFQFAYKIPAGVSFQVWVEPGTGSPTNRIDWGTITGDGTWQLAQRQFAGSPNSEKFRTQLNSVNSRNQRSITLESTPMPIIWLRRPPICSIAGTITLRLTLIGKCTL